MFFKVGGGCSFSLWYKENYLSFNTVFPKLDWIHFVEDQYLTHLADRSTMGSEWQRPLSAAQG